MFVVIEDRLRGRRVKRQDNSPLAHSLMLSYKSKVHDEAGAKVLSTCALGFEGQREPLVMVTAVVAR